MRPIMHKCVFVNVRAVSGDLIVPEVHPRSKRSRTFCSLPAKRLEPNVSTHVDDAGPLMRALTYDESFEDRTRIRTHIRNQNY